MCNKLMLGVKDVRRFAEDVKDGLLYGHCLAGIIGVR